ncbi:MAG TPA: adenylate/guanylate cyclase domain-containing protein [Pseudomonadales bacterium]|nr:adenylate/guanylate cyclase domain-containing protein [Pseudomonadales bacterium]
MINTYRTLNISTKLVILMLLVSLSGVALVAALGLRVGKAGLEERAYEQLTAIRAARTHQIEDAIFGMEQEVVTLAESVVTREALTAFRDALADPRAVGDLPPTWEADLRRHYSEEFLPALDAVAAAPRSLESLWPRTALARQLQYLYVAPGDAPAEEPGMRVDAGDGGAYSRAHARYHPHFRQLADRFEFFDLLLIEPEEATVVYSTHKEPDLGTRLEDGPYADSNLARAVRRAMQLDGEQVVFEDYAFFAPSRDAPVGFIASAIRDGDRLLGVLAVELPADRIDGIMTGDRAWQREGLGASGETYLVGRDGCMRSSSRFHLQDPDGFLEALRQRTGDAVTYARIARHGTTILAQDVRTVAVDRALAGESGTEIIDDYRGVPVLSSFAPLQVAGLDWVILSEIDLAEAHAPVTRFEQQVLLGAVVLAILAVLLSFAAARFFVRPILALISASRELGDGRWDVRVKMYTADELGELASSFNHMADNLQEQTETIVSRSREKEELLGFIRGVFGRFMSEDVARSLLDSPERIQLGGEVRDVTILLSDIEGYSTISEELPPTEVLSLLNDYFTAMNAVIDAHRGVVIEYLGDGILAVFGAPNDLPEHAEQAARCALAIRQRMAELNAEWAASGRAVLWQRHGIERLKTRVGLHSGPVVAGNLGSETRMKYAVVGDTVNVAARLEALNKELGTTILVSSDLADRLPPALLAEAEPRGTHRVKGRGREVRVLSF